MGVKLSPIKKFFTSAPPNVKSGLEPDDGPEGIHGVRTRPSKPIGQRAIDNPPDTAPVAEALKSLRKK